MLIVELRTKHQNKHQTMTNRFVNVLQSYTFRFVKPEYPARKGTITEISMIQEWCKKNGQFFLCTRWAKSNRPMFFGYNFF